MEKKPQKTHTHRYKEKVTAGTSVTKKNRHYIKEQQQKKNPARISIANQITTSVKRTKNKRKLQRYQSQKK